ncbi:MAG: cytochrome P450 [Steroidobacteraceae bacterium]
MQSNAAVDIDLNQGGTQGNAFIQQLGRLRELDPVHWSERSRCWLVTRHADVYAGLQGDMPLSLDRLITMGLVSIPVEERAKLFPTIMRYMPNWIINVDPPVHTRLRKLLVKAFTRKVVEGVRPFVRERVQLLMDKLQNQPEIEFNEEIARQLPGSVILKLLGLPLEHLPRLRDWSNRFQLGVGNPFADVETLKRVDEAMADMNAICSAELEKRRREPKDDLLTAMVQAVEDGEQLSMDEMLGALHVLIVAGHDTTSNTLSMGLAALAEHPETWDYLYRHPDKALETSLELMRFIAMSTSQPRIAMSDFTWHGKQIHRGDVVFLFLAAGNRDPHAFADPERMDPARNNEQSLVFAPGLHHCIGHLLAKMQVTEFFTALVTHFKGAQVLDDSIHYMPQVIFRGVFELNVRVTPRTD